MELMAPEGWNRFQTFSMATTLKAQDLGVRLPRFCSYVRQCKTLKLKLWESPPYNSGGTGDNPASRLVRSLAQAGISKYHPNPLKPLAEAQRKVT